MQFLLLCYFLQCAIVTLTFASNDVYDIGVGIADITGPSAEIQLWGYGTLKQAGGGIHTRIFSRAFIVGDGEKRVVLITTDMGSISHIVRMEVLRRLREMYGDLYTEQNVCLSATHTHSAPGGFHQYALYSMASGGFSLQNFRTVVDGIVQSVVNAHRNIKRGNIFWNSGILHNVNYNRSPKAYDKNPSFEKSRYEFNVGKDMQLIKMVDTQGIPMGMINWYPVHPTSMNNTNHLISSDNKGYAEIKFEELINGDNRLGKGPFVSAFPQESHGDASPNILGPRCIDTGEICDIHNMKCNGDVKKCVAIGPGKDMFESTEIIGERLKNKAVELFNETQEKITGKIQFIHQYYEISNVTIINGLHEMRTCKPAMGINFGLGTTDGAGENLPNIGKLLQCCHFKLGKRKYSIFIENLFILTNAGRLQAFSVSFLQDFVQDNCFPTRKWLRKPKDAPNFIVKAHNFD